MHALALSQPCMLLQGASLQCQWLAADSPARPLAHCLQASFLRNLPPIDHETADALDFEYQTRAETLLAVDDMIEAVIQVCLSACVSGLFGDSARHDWGCHSGGLGPGITHWDISRHGSAHLWRISDPVMPACRSASVVDARRIGWRPCLYSGATAFRCVPPHALLLTCAHAHSRILCAQALDDIGELDNTFMCAHHGMLKLGTDSADGRLQLCVLLSTCNAQVVALRANTSCVHAVAAHAPIHSAGCCSFYAPDNGFKLGHHRIP